MKKWINTLAIASIFAFSANALYAWGGPGNDWCGGDQFGRMMGSGWSGGFYGGGIFMMIFTTILIGLAIFFAVKFYRNKGFEIGRDENPLDILKFRYAKGEITKDEFIAMKKDIVNA